MDAEYQHQAQSSHAEGSGQTRLQPRPDWQRHRLARWLSEWRLMHDWQQACADDITGGVSRPLDNPSLTDHLADLRKKLVRPHDLAVNLQPGCIRLLSPSLMKRANRPVTLAVLGDWEPGWLLAAPFGSFSEPATTGELLLDSREPLHRVLCLWNAVTLPASLLQQSWGDGALEDAELQDAWSVFRHVTTGESLPERLVTRVGPPIVVPDDPRILYQDEETELLASLREKAAMTLKTE